MVRAFILGVVLSLVSAHAADFKPTSPFEQDFPFQMSCVGTKISTNIVPRFGPDGKQMVGPDGRPQFTAYLRSGDNTMKGLSLRLGNGAFACFDTDLLRLSASWTGAYMHFLGVAWDGRHGGWPLIAGEQKLGTPSLPGWADERGSFADTRKEPFGPIPATQGRWNGLYVIGDKTVLHYTVGGTKVWEFPTSTTSQELVGFVRNFQIEPAARDLAMLVCEMDNATGEIKGNTAMLKEGSCCATVAGLVGAPKGVTLEIQSKNRVVMKIAKGTPAALFQLVTWRGDQGYAERFENLTKGKPEMPDFKKGGSARWPQAVETSGALEMNATPDGAYVVDQLLVPEQNPWRRRVRLSGLDFFKDGTRAAVCTWDGDIWIVSGIDEKLEKLTWRRFASGLYEPLGLKIVDDVIYISARDGITRFHDLNGDGEADYYENFNNEVTSSTGFHEFVFDLKTDRAGNFYFSKAGPVRYGGRGYGTLAEDAGAGPIFGTITAHAGALLKVSRDGGKLDVVARGMRAPNGIGIGPNDELTSGDNEGTWVPVCPLNWVKPGSGTTLLHPDSHLRLNPAPNKPLMWFPLAWDNSGGGQVWGGEKFGPLKGELLHASYGRSVFYLIMKQPVGALMQGAAVRLPLKPPSSAMRPAPGPWSATVTWPT